MLDFTWNRGGETSCLHKRKTLECFWINLLQQRHVANRKDNVKHAHKKITSHCRKPSTSVDVTGNEWRDRWRKSNKLAFKTRAHPATVAKPLSKHETLLWKLRAEVTPRCVTWRWGDSSRNILQKLTFSSFHCGTMQSETLLHVANFSTLFVCMVLKFPQIFVLMRAKTTTGLSLNSLLLELIGYVISGWFPVWHQDECGPHSGSRPVGTACTGRDVSHPPWSRSLVFITQIGHALLNFPIWLLSQVRCLRDIPDVLWLPTSDIPGISNSNCTRWVNSFRIVYFHSWRCDFTCRVALDVLLLVLVLHYSGVLWHSVIYASVYPSATGCSGGNFQCVSMFPP